MAQPIGSLVIVLHGHLPYVLHHGSYPHGEAWLYEAAAETYLPLLDAIGEIALLGKSAQFTIGIMPVLMEQLAHERFKTGFVTYLNGRIERAEKDRIEFEAKGEKHFAYLAERWKEWYGHKLEHFARINQDIVGEFAQRMREGHIQILTSNATHQYMPLALTDESMRAQMACGVATSERHLGVKPRGMWLPECAYRPHWRHWVPPVLYDNPRDRIGVEHFIAEQGVTHFFVDSHLITGGQPMGTIDLGEYKPSSDDPSTWDKHRGWREPMSPVGVVSEPQMPRVFAYARHPRVSETVWSGQIGYPGSGEYMEFHRKYGERGLRYHKVTSPKTPLSDKSPYYPDDISGKIHEHAQHFANVIREELWAYHNRTGKHGVVVAPFDAELFGHWWFEGPKFLRDVVLNLSEDPNIQMRTAEDALWNVPADKVMRLPEGSWGANGDHTVWMAEKNRWIWEIVYRAEGRFLKLLHELPWKENKAIREMLERAGRQLLLLQASDWPFVIYTEGAVDYGTQRVAGHATRFDRLTLLAEKLLTTPELDALDKVQVAEADLHDSIFDHIDLNWWMPK